MLNRAINESVRMSPIFPDLSVTTPRLLLRAFGPADVVAVAEACSDEVTQRWLPLPQPYGIAEAEQWCLHRCPQFRAEGEGIQLAITERESGGRLVGCIGFKETDWQAGTTEVGYWCHPVGRNMGYTTEAVAELARWALSDFCIHRVELAAATGNFASQRVAEKAGFRFEGVARAAGHTHGGRVDMKIYSLIRADLDTLAPERSASA
jgi:RimJ/RimL family protein N-acetyltransferase